jgi:hypothetical protein
MAITAHATGTQASTIGTEHTLDDVAIAGVFQLYISLENLAAGDIVELRAYQIMLTGDTRKVIMKEVYSDAQPTDDIHKFFVPLANELTDAGSIRFTLKQTRGTTRNFKWKVLTLG